MKTLEELNVLKEEVENLNKKLAELSEEELEQVTGGLIPPYPPNGLVFGFYNKHDIETTEDLFKPPAHPNFLEANN